MSTTMSLTEGAARVLVVEDHPTMARLLSLSLADCGYDVDTAHTVKDALERDAAQPCDVLISDLGLPDGSGLELMRQLRRRRPVKGIAYSGYVLDEDIRASHEAGFVVHLTKPVEPEHLVETVRRVLAPTSSAGASRIQ